MPFKDEHGNVWETDEEALGPALARSIREFKLPFERINLPGRSEDWGYKSVYLQSPGDPAPRGDGGVLEDTAAMLARHGVRVACQAPSRPCITSRCDAT